MPTPEVSKDAIYARRSFRQAQLPKLDPHPTQAALEPPDLTDVVSFFLNLYRHQVGGGSDTPAEFSLLTDAGSNRVYELRVKPAREWIRRRLTIGSLNTESSYKSKCYDVVFDQHLVVKIPPKPILDFETYASGIQKERKIAERLAPRECIIPKVSVVLSQVHPLPTENGVLAGQLEENYLAWLRQNPSYQSCLKIKGSFVYFMDLPQHYFLSHILDRLCDPGQNLQSIAGIVGHLLDLLAWVDIKKVALQDLRADSLLAAGAAQKYPEFLRSPGNYTLAFINVEAAVSLNTNQEMAERLLLPWDPSSHATPSHLFPNSNLAACFGNPARVLHYQDWHAVIAMIFRAVTGEQLFDRTAKHLAEIRERAAGAVHSSEAPDEVLQDASRTFWRSAAAEFREKMKTGAKPLRSVEVDLPKPVRTLFVQALKSEIDFIHSEIEKRIEAQTWFATPKSREQLRAASYDQICRIMEDLRAEFQKVTGPAATLFAGADFLKDVAVLKSQAERKACFASRFESGAMSRMNTYDLLTLMFGRMLQVMYCMPWRNQEAGSTVAACLAEDESCMATMVDGPPEGPHRTDKLPLTDKDHLPAQGGAVPLNQKGTERVEDVPSGEAQAHSEVQNQLHPVKKHPTPNAHCAIAKTLLFQWRYEEAIANAETAIELDPKFPDGYFVLGVIKTFAGKSAEAIDGFKSALAVGSNNVSSCLYYLGLARYCLKQYDQAAASLENAIKLNPQYGPWPLAATFAQLNRGQEAADLLADYFEKRRWPIFFIENTFKAWPFKERNDMDHWAEGLRKSGLVRPWNPVYRRKYERAMADAEEAITRTPDDAAAQYTMGESLVYCGRSADAIDYLEKAIRYDPSYPGHYLFMLGLAHFSLERYEEAASFLEICFLKRKMVLNPPMWLLAATYAHIGRQSEAKEVLTNYTAANRFEGYTVERVLNCHLHAFKDPKDTERFARGLQKSGLPRD
jgi:tetratricopeptide (TPR) repeat protein